jgi:hypothetical protein
MNDSSQLTPRQIAGQQNRQKRNSLSPAARERLRQAVLRNRPWERSTGPRTPQGKLQAAHNGKCRQTGRLSLRELRALALAASASALKLANLRQQAFEAAQTESGP